MRSDARLRDAVLTLHGSRRKLSCEETAASHEQRSHRDQESTMESCARGDFLLSRRLSWSMACAQGSAAGKYCPEGATHRPE